MIILSYQVGTTNRPYFYRIWVSHPLPLAKVSFFLTDSISARVFSELVIDIHKRFFASFFASDSIVFFSENWQAIST